MKLKNLLQIFILLIISGFISSLFVARALDKKETNYLHKVNLKNIYQEPVLYGSGEVGDIIYDINCNIEIVTDFKEEIKNLSDLQKYCDNHLTSGNGFQYFLVDASGTFIHDGTTVEVKALNYVKNEGFFFEVEPVGDVITSGPFSEFKVVENDINEDINEFSNLTIKDVVSKSKNNLTESKSFSDFIDSNDSSNDNPTPVVNG